MLFGASLVSASPSSTRGVLAESKEERCRVAIAFADTLLAQLPGRVVFAAEGEQAYSSLDARGWLSDSGNPAPIPPSTLLEAANRRGRLDAMSLCPLFYSHFGGPHRERRGVISGSSIEVTAIDPSSQNKTTVSITLPVISSSRNSALLFSSQVSGPMAGGSYAYFLQNRPKKGWVIVSSKSLTVA